MTKTIFITGCSTGIGYDTSLALKDKGYRIIASCRQSKDVKHLQELGLEAIQMDLNCSQSIQQGFTELMALTQGQLDVLINNAGFGQTGALEDLSRTTLVEQFQTNVFGLMELTALVIPIMRQQGYGRILNLSSILGLVCMPFRGAYNASKYAVEALSDTLRLELHSAGIKVILIEPGPIESQFRDNAIRSSLKNINIEKSYFHQQYQYMLQYFQSQKRTSRLTKPSSLVINKILQAIESKQPKARYLVTNPAYFLFIMKKILPTFLLDKLLLILSRKELGE